MNRLEEYFRNPPEPEGQNDYFEIETNYDFFAVSERTAREVMRTIDETPSPRWIVFRDLMGARHRILANAVYRVSESTAAQRSARRAFWRDRKLEDKQDRRSWEDDG